MDPFERNQFFDAVFRGMAAPRNPFRDPESSEAAARHNKNKEIIRRLFEDGYRMVSEPLYDTLGRKVTLRIGIVRATFRRGRYPLIEERWFEDGQPINRDQAMRYRTREGGIMAVG
jgi:hypothetical protein